MERRAIIEQLNELSKQSSDLQERIAQLRDALLEPGESLEPVFPEWAQEKVDRRICLVCDEKIEPSENVNRGCHHAHMRRVFRAIERGDYTEFEAVELGLLAPKSPPGPKPKPLPLDPRVKAEAFAKLDEAAKKFSRKPKE